MYFVFTQKPYLVENMSKASLRGGGPRQRKIGSKVYEGGEGVIQSQ